MSVVIGVIRENYSPAWVPLGLKTYATKTLRH